MVIEFFLIILLFLIVEIIIIFLRNKKSDSVDIDKVLNAEKENKFSIFYGGIIYYSLGNICIMCFY